MTEIQKLSTEKLRQYYLNARTTYYQCGGHHKSDANEKLMHEYGDELRRRGHITPSNTEEGIFNGEGSY